MNHEQIDQFEIIDRYLMGKLPAEESTRFEEHFVDCRQCISRLQTTKAFLAELRQVGAEQAAQIASPQPSEVFVPSRPSRWRMPLAWAAVFLLLAVAAAALLLNNRLQHLRDERNQAESLSAQWQQRYEEERRAASLAESRLRETELQEAEQRRVLEARIKDEQAKLAKLAAEFRQRISPGSNVPIFALRATRGGEARAAESANPIALPAATTMFVISISLEGEKGFASYRITILDQHQQSRWTSRLLTPDDSDSLSLPFEAKFFRPGQFTLLVEGVGKGGRKAIVGLYPFTIIKPR
jgi:hypothetical protein